MSSNERVTIPVAMQLCLDDVAWHNGADLRWKGQASRSGIPRYHAPEDYRMLEELGRAVNMKITCPLCLADWDKDNILRGEVGITHNPYGWDRASEIDYDYANACAEEMRRSEYMEFAYHGLLHGRYSEDGRLLTETEYFSKQIIDGKSVFSIDAADFAHRLDLFEHIYNSWNFGQKIRTFVSPCGVCNATLEQMHVITSEVEKRGVKYWLNWGFSFDEPFMMSDGVACLKKNGAFNGKPVPWDAYDFDPRYLGEFCAPDSESLTGIFGLHWTNFLHFNPENNLERLGAWVDYFKRQAETFGMMISRDVAFSANQMFFAEHAKLKTDSSECTVDISEVLAVAPKWLSKEFYISFKKDFLPAGCEGGEMELYEEHKDFNTYKISFTQSKVVIR